MEGVGFSEHQSSFSPILPPSFPQPSHFCLALDIETTGLSPDEDQITCIGIQTQSTTIQLSSYVSTFLTDRDSAESQILHQFQSFFQQLHLNKHNNHICTIITYNGNFDLSFLFKRAKHYDLNFDFLNSFYHIDLSLFSKSLAKRLISKDEACRKFANLYIPYKNSGAYLARIYRYHQLTLEDHIDMLSHNAIDLGATFKYYHKLFNYPDFQQFYKDLNNQSSLKISKEAFLQ